MSDDNGDAPRIESPNFQRVNERGRLTALGGKIAVVATLMLASVGFLDAATKLLGSTNSFWSQLKVVLGDDASVSSHTRTGAAEATDGQKHHEQWYAAMSSYDAPNFHSPADDAVRAAKVMGLSASVAIYRINGHNVVTLSGPLPYADAVAVVDRARSIGLAPTGWANDRARFGTKIATCDDRKCTWLMK
ncbi:hypothetical protein [Rhodopseudomonas sp. BR0G17]|uniref:hypothetical protein n=1 Tax=Rhodopseudomonas sp. BR0G17 TaxID=2269368 RepID=UPI0013E04A41|nr:hypothetical protein [Rhodopseudomonas sp. BR0G17]